MSLGYRCVFQLLKKVTFRRILAFDKRIGPRACDKIHTVYEATILIISPVLVGEIRVTVPVVCGQVMSASANVVADSTGVNGAV